jgi:hypothetical protein
MTSHKVTRFSILMGTLFLTIATCLVWKSDIGYSSESTIDQTLKLDQTEALLAQRRQNLSDFLIETEKYKRARDFLFYSDVGYQKVSTDLISEQIKWMENWFTLLAEADAAFKSQNKMPPSNLIFQVKNLVGNWGLLKEKKKNLTHLANDIQTSLDEIESLPSGFLPVYSSQVSGFNSQVRAFKDAFNRTRGKQEEFQARDWTLQLNELNAAIEARLKLSMLKYPELSRELEKVRAMLMAEVGWAPEISSLEARALQTQSLFISMRFFQASENLEVLEQKGKNLSDEIVNSDFESEIKTELLKRISSLLERAIKAREQVLRFAVPSELIVGLQSKLGPVIAAKCRNPQTAGSVNCEIFRTAFSIPSEEILKMNNNQLKHLEKTMLQATLPLQVGVVEGENR